MIPEQAIRQIQDRLDIVDVVGGYLPLKRAGRHYKALCPFHQEKTPSFMVNPTKQIFHCFGCGEGGDAISFVMKYERMEFPEAVRTLAPRVGVEVPDVRPGGPKVSEASELSRTLEFAAAFFQQTLQQPVGAPALAYLTGRGVTAASVQELRLGFAPESWDALLGAAQASGIRPEIVERVGLAVAREGRGGWYDRFRGRIMFPVWDAKGKVIGFGGRVLDDSQPKYMNSPETEVYVKSRVLYGLHVAAPHIREHDYVAIVEGYLDFLIPYQLGIRNLVASMGTSLTVDQIQLLRRYTRHVVIVYDGDYAGELATLRGLDLLLGEGMQVKVVGLPPGEDPDSAARRLGAEGFRQLLADAQDLFAYKLAILRRRHNPTTIEGKVAICEQLLPTIKRVPNATQASEYVRTLAGELRVREEDLRSELARVKLEGSTPWRPTTLGDAVKPQTSAERLLLGLVLDDPRYLNRVAVELAWDELQDEAVRNALMMLAERALAGEGDVSRGVQELKSGDTSSVIVQALVESERMDDKPRALEDCLRRIRSEAVSRRLAALQTRIQLAERSGDDQHVTTLIGEYNQLVKQQQANTCR